MSDEAPREARERELQALLEALREPEIERVRPVEDPPSFPAVVAPPHQDADRSCPREEAPLDAPKASPADEEDGPAPPEGEADDAGGVLARFRRTWSLLPLPSFSRTGPSGAPGEDPDQAEEGDPDQDTSRSPPIHLGPDATVEGGIHEPTRTVVLEEGATVRGDIRARHLVLSRGARVLGRVQADRIDYGEGSVSGPVETRRGLGSSGVVPY